MEALEYLLEKRFHSSITLDEEDFIYPQDRSERYIIIDISILHGALSKMEPIKRPLLPKTKFLRMDTHSPHHFQRHCFVEIFSAPNPAGPCQNGF
jgi:hypothetical protein